MVFEGNKLMNELLLSCLPGVELDSSRQDILLDLLKRAYTRIAVVDILHETVMTLYDATGFMEEGVALSYASALDKFLLRNVMEEDRSFAKAELSLDSLREFYRSGSGDRRLEFRSFAKESNYEWCEIILATVTIGQRGVVYILQKNINEQKLMHGIIDRFIYHDCDYFIYLDVKKDSYIMFSHSDSGTPLPPTTCDSYSTEIVKYAEEFVVPEERAYTVWQMSPKRVVEQLDEKGEHVFYVGVMDATRGYTRKCLKYVYFDKENHMVLLIRTDITDLYLEEQEKQKALSDALEVAKEASCSKSRFLAQMSHELRTPMNAIIGLNEIMKTNLNDKSYLEECLQKSQSASKYLLSLLNDVLDMSRIENGKVDLVNECFSFSQLLDDINAMMRPAAQAKKICYNFVSHGSFAAAYSGDKIRLQQVVINLLNNAIKFTPEEGSITFEATVLPEGNRDLLIFVIADNGIGISSEFMPYLFDSFAQEHASGTSYYGGGGLGLSISRQLLNLMGGTIEVESEIGAGSTFTVSVSLRRCESSAMEESVSAGSESLVSLRGHRVLLVEDHPMNAMIARKLLEQKGMLVETAQNGKEGVDLFARSDVEYYDAILMDIRMPVMDGLTAAKIIRKLPHRQAKLIPIVAMTANAFDEDVLDSRAAGMQAHLAKPIDPKTLYATLAENLSKDNLTSDYCVL